MENSAPKLKSLTEHNKPLNFSHGYYFPIAEQIIQTTENFVFKIKFPSTQSKEDKTKWPKKSHDKKPPLRLHYSGHTNPQPRNEKHIENPAVETKIREVSRSRPT